MQKQEQLFLGPAWLPHPPPPPQNTSQYFKEASNKIPNSCDDLALEVSIWKEKVNPLPSCFISSLSLGFDTCPAHPFYFLWVSLPREQNGRARKSALRHMNNP